MPTLSSVNRSLMNAANSAGSSGMYGSSETERYILFQGAGGAKGGCGWMNELTRKNGRDASQSRRKSTLLSPIHCVG